MQLKVTFLNSSAARLATNASQTFSTRTRRRPPALHGELQAGSNAYVVELRSSKIWFESNLVVKQLDGIGPKYAKSLVSAGKNFKAIKESISRDLERVMGIALLGASASLLYAETGGYAANVDDEIAY